MEEYGTVRKSGRTHVSPRFSSLLLLSSRQSGATCQSGEGRERSSECFVALARERAGGRGSGSLSIKREAARRWAVGCHSRRHFPPLFPLSCLIISLSSSACHFKWLFPPYSLSLCCGSTEHSYSPPPQHKKNAHTRKGRSGRRSTSLTILPWAFNYPFWSARLFTPNWIKLQLGYFAVIFHVVSEG